MKLDLPAALPFIFNALKINAHGGADRCDRCRILRTPTQGIGFASQQEAGRMAIDMVWAEIALAGRSREWLLWISSRSPTRDHFFGIHPIEPDSAGFSSFSEVLHEEHSGTRSRRDDGFVVGRCRKLGRTTDTISSWNGSQPSVRRSCQSPTTNPSSRLLRKCHYVLHANTPKSLRNPPSQVR